MKEWRKGGYVSWEGRRTGPPGERPPATYCTEHLRCGVCCVGHATLCCTAWCYVLLCYVMSYCYILIYATFCYGMLLGSIMLCYSMLYCYIFLFIMLDYVTFMFHCVMFLQ